MAVGGAWPHLLGGGETKRALFGGIKKWEESSLDPWGLLSWHQSSETYCEREVCLGALGSCQKLRNN